MAGQTDIFLLNNAEKQYSNTEGGRKKDAVGDLQKNCTWTVHIKEIPRVQRVIQIPKQQGPNLL